MDSSARYLVCLYLTGPLNPFYNFKPAASLTLPILITNAKNFALFSLQNLLKCDYIKMVAFIFLCKISFFNFFLSKYVLIRRPIFNLLISIFFHCLSIYIDKRTEPFIAE